MSDDVGLLVDHDDDCDDVDDEELVDPLWEDNYKQRQVNYGRLCMLIIGEGTKRLREYTKQNLQHKDVSIRDLLRVQGNQKKFLQLKKDRKLAGHQYKILYPEDGSSFRESDVDISLWVFLARNLMAEEIRTLINWDKTPDEEDDLDPHHMIRLRDARNRLHHMSQTELTTAAFESTWQSIAISLIRLGSTQHDLNRLKTCDLDPESTKAYVYEVKQQALMEQNAKLEVDASNKHWLLRGFVVILVLFIIAFVAIIIVVVLYSKEIACSNYIQRVRTKEVLMQYMPRSGWGARNAEVKNMLRFHGPVDYMVVSQTALNGNCLSHGDCCQACQMIQDYNMGPDVGMSDIAFSYMIGGDGVAYEGRGQFYVPAVVPGRNKVLLSMGFIGYFTNNKPTADALNTAQILIQYLVDIGALSHNTTVLGLCQMYGKKYPRSPGVAIMNEMKNWKGNGWSWQSVNSTQCEGFHHVEDLLP